MNKDGMTEEQKAYVKGLEAALQARSAEVKELKHLLAVAIQKAQSGTSLRVKEVHNLYIR